MCGEDGAQREVYKLKEEPEKGDRRKTKGKEKKKKKRGEREKKGKEKDE